MISLETIGFEFVGNLRPSQIAQFFSYRPGLLIDIERDPREIVIRRADTFVVGRADFDCHERSSTGGSLIRGTSSRN